MEKYYYGKFKLTEKGSMKQKFCTFSAHKTVGTEHFSPKGTIYFTFLASRGIVQKLASKTVKFLYNFGSIAVPEPYSLLWAPVKEG